MGRRQSRNRVDRTRCAEGIGRINWRLRIYERRKRIQGIMNGETDLLPVEWSAGREGNKGGRLLREIFIARDISQLHLLTVYEGDSGERGGRNFPLRFRIEFQLSLNIIGWNRVGKKQRKQKRKRKNSLWKTKKWIRRITRVVSEWFEKNIFLSKL